MNDYEIERLRQTTKIVRKEYPKLGMLEQVQMALASCRDLKRVKIEKIEDIPAQVQDLYKIGRRMTEEDEITFRRAVNDLFADPQTLTWSTHKVVEHVLKTTGLGISASGVARDIVKEMRQPPQIVGNLNRVNGRWCFVLRFEGQTYVHYENGDVPRSDVLSFPSLTRRIQELENQLQSFHDRQPPVETPTSSTVEEDLRPKVLVYGPNADQEKELVETFGDVVNLSFANSLKSLDRKLTARMYLIQMVRFTAHLPHRLKVRGIETKYAPGGVYSVGVRIQEILDDLSIKSDSLSEA